MRIEPFIIFIYWLVTRLSFRYPRIILQKGKKYTVKKWEGGTFYYTTFLWHGLPFGKALDIIRGWAHISKERGKNELALGRYPNDENWQIGFIAKSKFNLKTFMGLKVEKDKVLSGSYAVLQGQGYPEHIFVYWFWLRRQLFRDHYKPDRATFEIYDNNTFNDKIPGRKRKGEIRYRVEPLKGKKK